jgi:hypothetical protein
LLRARKRARPPVGLIDDIGLLLSTVVVAAGVNAVVNDPIGCAPRLSAAKFEEVGWRGRYGRPLSARQPEALPAPGSATIKALSRGTPNVPGVSFMGTSSKGSSLRIGQLPLANLTSRPHRTWLDLQLIRARLGCPGARGSRTVRRARERLDAFCRRSVRLASGRA